MVHAAAKGVRTGQVSVKLLFDVEDVPGFCEKSAGNGLIFSAEHPADGYSYANAKDPCGNNIQVSSRAFRKVETVAEKNARCQPTSVATTWPGLRAVKRRYSLMACRV